MSRLLRIRRYRWLNLMAVLGLILALSLPGVASGDTTNDSVTVTATNATKLTVTWGDTSAAFGTGLDPEGTAATSSDTVTDVQGSTGQQGSYYIWQGAAGTGQIVTVKSNKAWDGTLQASENGGAGAAASLTVTGGALRYCTSVPGTYDAASSCTALSTVATKPASGPDWDNAAKGSTEFTFYYVLRVDWNDDPGTFTSAITMTITQL